MLLNGTLEDHISEIGRQAEEICFRLIEQMAEQEGVTEQLKAENQMDWVQAMNSTSQSAEEIVNNEIIFA